MAPDPSAEARGDAPDNAVLLEAVAELLRLVASAYPAPATSGRDGAASQPGSTEGVRLLSRLVLTCAASSLRYWGRTAEMWGRAIPLLVDMLAEVNGPPRDDAGAVARRMDELRAALREFAQLPAQESRRLGAEIERIVLGDAPRTEPDPPAATEVYWRRWEAKP